MVTVYVEPSGDGWKCLVTVDQGDDRTTHAVTVKRADAERWARGIEPSDVHTSCCEVSNSSSSAKPPGRSSRHSTLRRSSAISPSTTD